MTNKQVLLIIAAFVALTLGSFIWYIATWDAEARVSLGPTLALLENTPAGGIDLRKEAQI